MGSNSSVKIAIDTPRNAPGHSKTSEMKRSHRAVMVLKKSEVKIWIGVLKKSTIVIVDSTIEL